MVAGIKSEWWPASNRNLRPDCVGIRNRAKLVDAIIQIGASLSLQTTAEGIEDDANLDWLSDQGCDFGQGYLFGRPMSKEDADSFIRAGKVAPSSPAAHAA